VICIIDYGLGNIHAFSTIYKRLNISCTIVKTADDLQGAEKLILPGVGDFDHAMKLLEASGMRVPLDELVLKQNVPVLGICVGMQMMAERSDEGDMDGLGWISGSVRQIDISRLNQKPHLPHMGWNVAEPERSNSLFEGIDLEKGFYFLHAYYFDCANPTNSLARSDYGNRFTSAVNRDNIYGVQFHPEKSHSNGIQILKNFAGL